MIPSCKPSCSTLLYSAKSSTRSIVFFLSIFFFCIALQAIIVNFGGAAFQVTQVDGVAWAISLVVGLLALPIGVIIRLIPDEVFGFVFMFNPAARQRYLGGNNESASPSVYVAGNERIAWNNNGSAYNNGTSVSNNKQVQQKQEIEEVEEVAPAYTPATSNAGMTEKYTNESQSFEDENQDTVLSSGSLDESQRNN
ncbi:hypothetical protein G6F42_018138 [Rhizopus arrhizus]|nr:hypothetical protein G6F42_018138 [Rhizopus arrhizus]